MSQFNLYDGKMTINRADGNEIEISSTRVACISDKVVKEENGQPVDYVFMCVYDMGTFDSKKHCGRNIYPGYFYIRRAD